MAPLPAVFRETKVSSISFFLIGPSGARKHHINSSLKRFIYKSVIFMEAVETEYVFCQCKQEKNQFDWRTEENFCHVCSTYVISKWMPQILEVSLNVFSMSFFLLSLIPSDSAASLHRGREREIPEIAVPPLGTKRWVSAPHSEVTALKWTVYSGHVNSSDVYDALLCFKMFSFWVYLYTNSTYKEAYLIRKIILQSYKAGRVIQTSLGRECQSDCPLQSWADTDCHVKEDRRSILQKQATI